MGRINNQLKTVALLGVLSALVVGVGGAVAPGHLGIFLIMALGMNLGAYFFSDRLVLRMHNARELSAEEAPPLHQAVEDLARRAGIPKPRLFLIDEPNANAFATGRNPEHGVVAVTAGILRILTPRELRGVLAHEIAHIRNRDILLSTVAASMVAVVTYIGQVLSFGALFGGASRDEEEGSGAGALVVALAAPLLATVVQLGISRSREYLADETGAALAGDPDALADALLKLEHAAELIPAEAHAATASLFIVNSFAGGQMMARLFSTHPPMADRVARLRAMHRLD